MDEWDGLSGGAFGAPASSIFAHFLLFAGPWVSRRPKAILTAHLVSRHPMAFFEGRFVLGLS